MLKPHDVMASSDYKATYGTYVSEEDYSYICTDYVHKPTGNVVSVIELMLREVGKDELDALYRVQRIIEDKIHEVRNRPLQNEVVSVNPNKNAVAACDDDLLYPGTIDPFA
jgi:hypothetical protein